MAVRVVFRVLSLMGRFVRKKKPSVVLVPKKRIQQREALLVLLPGAFKDPELYVPLAESLQEECEERNVGLYVTISDLPFGLGTETDAKYQYEAALEEAKMLGFDPQESSDGTSEKVYVGGHSWGGAIGRNVGYNRARGVILFGAFFSTMSNPSGDTVPTSLSKWYKPALVVAGELDGQARITYAALDWKEAHDTNVCTGGLELNDPLRCIAVVENMNHSQFCDGVANVGRGDIQIATDTIASAHKKVASISADFIAADQLKDPGCIDRLTKEVAHMQTMIRPFLAAFDEDVDRESAKDAQVYIGKGILSKEQISTIVHKERKAFIFSKPQLDKMDGAFHCTVQLLAEEDATHFGGRRNCRNRLGSLLWVKAKSPEAINAFRKHDLGPFTTSDCAAGINVIIYQKALEMVSPRARERFINLGRPLRFVPDYQAKSGLNWVNTRVKYTMGEDGCLEVCCPSLHTGLDTLARYAGMQYVKVFSLALMIEYILVDAFSAIEGLGYVDR